MDGVLPVSFSLNTQEDIEEEHRLFYVGITRAKNHLFLSLHHEGTRGGINQFNKISRFVDFPNVLSKLENITEKKIVKAVVPKEPEKITPIYNKKSLLEKVIDFFK
jgi:superfamily I DNA/RNA helicase